VWGGYSYESVIAQNEFTGNRTGIAIEHGQRNEIAGNDIYEGVTGINLWADKIEPSDWGYPKHRDTRSMLNTIRDNTISDVRLGIRVSNTTTTRITGNKFTWMPRLDSVIVRRDSTSIVTGGNLVQDVPDFTKGDRVKARPIKCAPEPALTPRLPGGYRSSATECGVTSQLRPDSGLSIDQRELFDRDAIIVDEWGPYSYTYPRLWPVDTVRGISVELRVLGPAGTWRVVSSRNVSSISRRSGSALGDLPGHVDFRRDTTVITPETGHETDWSIDVEFRGDSAVTDSHGVRYAPGKPYTFSFGRFEPITGWDVSFYTWPDSAKPREKLTAFDPVYRATVASAPLLTRHETRLDYMFYGAGIKGIPQDRWAAVATTTVDLATGSTYTLRALSDDGARVYVDGKLAIDSWAPHETAVGNAPVTPGRHDIRVEYYQIDGWSELRVEIVKGVQKSSGSPGPH
jgi:parallel beta-helix repeat protein